MREPLPESLKKLYPFQSKYLRLKCGNVMHYIDEGPEEVVLFLHGNPTWSFFFRNLILLLKRDFRCIAIDHIGYGMSDKPQKYQYNIATHIENAIHFAEAMKFKKFHIVAQDFGVAIAMAMAERWPERITSMAFLNSTVSRLTTLPSMLLFFKFPVFTFLFARLLNLFVRLNIHFGTVGVLDRDVIKGYLWPYRHFSDRIAIAGAIEDVPWLPDHPSMETLERLINKAYLLENKKIKFFWANDDMRYSSVALYSWRDVLPNAWLKTYDRVGHLSLEDSEEVVSDVRAFISKWRNINKDLFH